MSAVDDVISLLAAARERVETSFAPLEGFRQGMAEAAGTLMQAGGDYYSTMANEIATSTDLATQAGDAARQVIDSINNEISALQRHR